MNKNLWKCWCIPNRINLKNEKWFRIVDCRQVQSSIIWCKIVRSVIKQWSCPNQLTEKSFINPVSVGGGGHRMPPPNKIRVIFQKQWKEYFWSYRIMWRVKRGVFEDGQHNQTIARCVAHVFHVYTRVFHMNTHVYMWNTHNSVASEIFLSLLLKNDPCLKNRS